MSTPMSTPSKLASPIFDNRLRRRFKTSVVHQNFTTDTVEFKYYEVDTQGVILQKNSHNCTMSTFLKNFKINFFGNKLFILILNSARLLANYLFILIFLVIL